MKYRIDQPAPLYDYARPTRRFKPYTTAAQAVVFVGLVFLMTLMLLAMGGY